MIEISLNTFFWYPTCWARISRERAHSTRTDMRKKGACGTKREAHTDKSKTRIRSSKEDRGNGSGWLINNWWREIRCSFACRRFVIVISRGACPVKQSNYGQISLSGHVHDLWKTTRWGCAAAISKLSSFFFSRYSILLVN